MRSPVAAWSWGPELGRVVGDQFRPVARPADLDIEALLRGEMRVAGLHGGDHVVDRVALEGVQGGRAGPVPAYGVKPRHHVLGADAVERHPAKGGHP